MVSQPETDLLVAVRGAAELPLLEPPRGGAHTDHGVRLPLLLFLNFKKHHFQYEIHHSQYELPKPQRTRMAA